MKGGGEVTELEYAEFEKWEAKQRRRKQRVMDGIAIATLIAQVAALLRILLR